MAEARIVRRGEGAAYEDLWLFKHGSLDGGRFDFMVGSVGYLGGPPLHVHDEQDDTFFVLDGILAVQVGEEIFDLHPGDFATVPPGIAHTFDNVRKDQGPVRACNLMTPGGLDAQFRDMAALRAEDAGSEAMAALRARHGVRTVGPTIGAKLGLV